MNSKRFLMAVLLLSLSIFMSGCNLSMSREADRLLENKQFDEAKEIFQQLADEESSHSQQETYINKVLECDYQKANQLFHNADYITSTALFETICGYKDTEELLLESKYRLADYYVDNDDYFSASAIFKELNDYKDSAEIYKDCLYHVANFYALNEEYELAYEAFFTLKDYRESSRLAEQCEKNRFSKLCIGDVIHFGTFEIDGNTENGRELIPWRVLAINEDYVYLITRDIIDMKRFDGSPDGYHWENCDLRKWLNEEFYKTSFTDKEKEHIQPVITSDKTKDSVFCPSAEEVRIFFKDQNDRIAYAVDAVLANGYEIFNEDHSVEWWTRSVSTAANGKGVVPVESDGNVRSAGTAPNVPNAYSWGNYYNGVRPAICISISGNISSEPKNMDAFGCNSDNDLDNEPYIAPISKGGSGRDCPCCGGTGMARYNYGDSDLEAWLTGHDAYTLGECPMCHGTGKVE